jgi:hypothetical protein
VRARVSLTDYVLTGNHNHNQMFSPVRWARALDRKNFDRYMLDPPLTEEGKWRPYRFLGPGGILAVSGHVNAIFYEHCFSSANAIFSENCLGTETPLQVPAIWVLAQAICFLMGAPIALSIGAIDIALVSWQVLDICL